VAEAALPAISSAAAQLGDRTRHHIALRLLPFLFTRYIVNYVDRTNVAYAAIGMSRDLGFSDRVFGMGAGIFFISYVALQIPGALLVERWSAAPDDLRDHDRVGIVDGANSTGTNTSAAIHGTLCLRRGGGWFLPGSHRLSEPLVYA
jgi:hypothetical protein